jgi:hypothetical protein
MTCAFSGQAGTSAAPGTKMAGSTTDPPYRPAHTLSGLLPDINVSSRQNRFNMGFRLDFFVNGSNLTQ